MTQSTSRSKTAVTITELTGDRPVHRSEHQTDDETVALRRAIEKAYGRGAYLVPDAGLHGLPHRYGQIVRDMRSQGNGWQATCLTGRVSVRVETE
jgi:hypothetical protein